MKSIEDYIKECEKGYIANEVHWFDTLEELVEDYKEDGDELFEPYDIEPHKHNLKRLFQLLKQIDLEIKWTVDYGMNDLKISSDPHFHGEVLTNEPFGDRKYLGSWGVSGKFDDCSLYGHGETMHEAFAEFLSMLEDVEELKNESE